MKTRYWFTVAAAVFSLFLTACGDYTGKEKTHPVFVKAGACKSGGDFKEAARYFEEFLLVCPKSAKTHYELATLYSENLDDPASAICHFKRYLALSPENSDDAEDIQKLITAAEKQMFANLSKKYESPENAKAVEQLKKTQETLQKYIVYSNKLRALYTELAQQNQDLRKLISSGKVVSNKAPRRIQASAPAAESSPSAQQDTRTTSSRPMKYRVKAGDNLYKISREVYGSTKHYQLIIKANNLRGPIRVGQELIIPQLSNEPGQ